MKDKINTLFDLLQGTESIEFSIYRGKPDEYNGKPRIELHLTDWYKPIFGDSWDECIDKAIEFIKGENKMNCEERYKQALERAKEKRDEYKRLDGEESFVPSDIEYIFPELAESEDDKIRKALITFFQRFPYENLEKAGLSVKDAIAWLEKQGGEATDKVEPKFKAGDWITNGEYIWKVTDIKPLDYILQSQNGGVVDDTISYVDENLYLWTIQDAKDGDVLFTTCDNINEMVFIYRGIEFDTTHCYFLYSKTNNECKTFNSVCSVKADIHPATKEQRDLLFSKMKEAGYEWDSEKKELKKIEQKSWSEEDEKMFDEVCSSIKYAEKHRITCPEKLAKLQLDWLKSIKNRVQPKQEWSKEDKEMLDSIIDCIDGLCFIDSDQLNWLKSLKSNRWKPSEEQMKALETTIHISNFGLDIDRLRMLESLYNDLKKL